MSSNLSPKKTAKKTRPILNFFQSLISNKKIKKSNVRITKQAKQTTIFVKENNKNDLFARINLLVYDKFSKTRGLFKRAKKGSEKFDVRIEIVPEGLKIKERRIT